MLMLPVPLLWQVYFKYRLNNDPPRGLTAQQALPAVTAAQPGSEQLEDMSDDDDEDEEAVFGTL